MPSLDLDILTLKRCIDIEVEALNTIDEFIREGMGWRNLYIISYETNPLLLPQPRDSGSPWEWHHTTLRRDGLTGHAEVITYGATNVIEFYKDDGVRTILTRDSPRALMGYGSDISILVNVNRASNVRTIYVPQGPLPRWAEYEHCCDDL